MRLIASLLVALALVPSLALADAPKLADDLDEVRAELQKVDKLLSENTRESAGRAQERLSIAREKFDKLTERLNRGEWKSNDKAPNADKPVEKRVVIDDQAFRALGKALSEERDPALKETLLKTQLASTWVTLDQTLRLLKTYRHDDERMAALKLIAPRLVDHKNTLAIRDAFDHADEKDKALKIVSQ